MSEHTEPTKAAQAPELWPIRVGGIYQAVSYKSILRRVTAIDGDEIYYEQLRENGVVLLTGCTSSTVFRQHHLPEPKSPISALVEALKLIVNDPDTRMRSSHLALAFAALAKAEADSAYLGGD